MSLENRKIRIESILRNTFDPILLEVRDDSNKHSGHSAIEKGALETHFYIKMTANSFKGLSKVIMHRQVYEVLKNEFKVGLHAIELDLNTEL